MKRLCERMICPGCFCLGFGPGHLIHKYVFGIDCNHA